MRTISRLTTLTSISVLTVAIIAAGIMSCGTSAPDETNNTTYKLTHSAADVEYILSWDKIVSQCPDIGAYDEIEAFVHRGESTQYASGENFSLGDHSPAAWSSMRLARTEWAGQSFRSFMIQVSFCETTEDIDELVDMLGFTVQKEGDFVTASRETGTPLKSLELLLAGNHFAVVMGEFATPEDSLLCDKVELMQLLSIAKDKISLSETTPLPSEIPQRISRVE
jgi:hypothetical protein